MIIRCPERVPNFLVAPFNDIPDWNNEEFRIPKKIKFKKVKRKPIKTTQRPKVETTTTTTTTTGKSSKIVLCYASIK